MHDRYNHAKQRKGIILGLAVILVSSSWIWLPAAIFDYQTYTAVSAFRSNEAFYAGRADRMLKSRVSIGDGGTPNPNGTQANPIPIIGSLPDGSRVVIFPRGDGKTGYLCTSRSLHGRDIDDADDIILHGDISRSSIYPLFVGRTIQAGWYYVRHDAS